MDQETPGGDASRHGDLPSNFDEWTAPQQGASPPSQPPADPGTVRSKQRHRFTVQSGSKSAQSGQTGGPAGSAPGNADPQLRHGIEVVHVADYDEASDQPPLEDDIAARMMHEIEEAVAELRRHAVGRLISLQRPNETPPEEEQPAEVKPCGVLSRLLTRIQERARRLAAEKPIPTMAALIALGFAFGAALRLRK